ncbi:MAG: hypothetical protein HZA17_06835 [Nitrospirae bacterium]|nr:hypothetical protein [Nitrospirota bacterium]
MEKYTCPSCQKTTYTAYKDRAHYCPYCNTEKLLIFNPRVFGTGLDLSDAKILFDRRNSGIPQEMERRGKDTLDLVPIAWLVIKQKSTESAI